MNSSESASADRLESGVGAGMVEIVVPYTDALVTRAVLKRVSTLTAGLEARVLLVAIHAVPFPADFKPTASSHAFLVERLLSLADCCNLPVEARIVMARTRDEGYCWVLKPGSTCLVGSRRRLWRTPEEKLARTLQRLGHKVAVVYVEDIDA